MAESFTSARAALADADAVIARVSAKIGEPIPMDGATTEFTAYAHRVADEWERYTLSIVDEARLEEAARSFRQRWPALVRWRDKVLKNRRHEKPSVIAAAFESLALECLLAGESELSARAQHEAMNIMSKMGRVRRVQPNPTATTEAKSA